jgi:hypothetical protein
MPDNRPVVRYLIVCDDVRLDPDEPRGATVVGPVSALRSLGEPAFPLYHPEICVFVQLTDCRGVGDVRVEVRRADGTSVFRTRTRSVPFGDDPTEIVGLSFRLRNVAFPAAGLYWVELWYNDGVLARQPLELR